LSEPLRELHALSSQHASSAERHSVLARVDIVHPV
jgi:hypothetical protein